MTNWQGRYRWKRFGRKALVALTVVLFAAALVVGNLCACLAQEKFGLAADLTAGKVYELSRQSEEILASVSKPVDIVVMMDAYTLERGGGYFAQAKRILDQFSRCNEKITVQYVDLVRNPAYASAYPALSLDYYDIVIDCSGKLYQTSLTDLFQLGVDAASGKRYILASQADQVLTSAIVRLTSENRERVTLLTGHGETYPQGFVDLLANNGYEVTERNLLTEGLDGQADVVISFAPVKDYGEEQLKGLEDYLTAGERDGGCFLYAPSDGSITLPGLESFLARWGIGMERNMVMESNGSNILDNLAYMCLVEYASGEYQERLPGGDSVRVLCPMGRGLQQIFSQRGGYVTEVLLAYSAGAFRVPVGAGAEWAPAREDFGSSPALIRSTYAGPAGKEGRIFVFAAPGCFEESILQSGYVANADYLLALLHAQTGQGDMVQIAPKVMGGRRLQVTRREVYGLGILFVAVVPLACLAAGMGVWIYRRRR